MASISAEIPDDEEASVVDDRAEEARLVDAARAGYAPAFDVLIDQYYKPILHYLIGQTNDAERAKELTQETFEHAFLHLRDLTRDTSFKSWLYTIASNALKVDRRRAQVFRFVSFEWLTERIGGIRSADRDVDSIWACHERDHMQRIFDDLSPLLREALLLHVEEGYSAPQIAEMLGIGRWAAERRISRAKIEFQRRYLALGGGLNHETM